MLYINVYEFSDINHAVQTEVYQQKEKAIKNLSTRKRGYKHTLKLDPLNGYTSKINLLTDIQKIGGILEKFKNDPNYFNI